MEAPGVLSIQTLALKFAFLICKSMPWQSLEHRSRRILALPRISSGRLMPLVRSSCSRRARLRRCFRCLLMSSSRMRICGCICRSVSNRAPIGPSEGPIGALLDTERQIHPQILIRELDISRQRKQRRNRARLEQEDLTRGINRPLDVLGSAKMRLDLCSKLCQGMDLQIRKANFSARVWMLNTPGASIDYCLDDRALVAQATFDDLTVDSIHDKVVRIGRAGNDGFTQAGIGINHDLSALASKRVGSEEHPGSRSLHHPLDDDCHPHSSRIETRACAIH